MPTLRGQEHQLLYWYRPVWFTTKYETANGLVLFACSDTNRHKCPNLPKLKPAIAKNDNDTGGDALTP
jgi:hypothetical protein